MRWRTPLPSRTPERPAGNGWRPIIPARAFDIALALAVAALGVVSGLGALHQREHIRLAAIPVLGAMGLILLARRRLPGTVLVAMAAMVAALAAMRTSLEGAFVAVLVSSYSAAVYGGRYLARGLAAAGVAAFLAVGLFRALGVRPQLVTAVPVPTLLAAAGAWLVGLAIRSQFATRNAHLAVLEERAELVAARQEEQSRRATLAERLRIARELHDIVAHHLSVVVIQAQGAQRMVSLDPGRAEQAMADIERTGRTALDEMRRLLGLLRSGDADNGQPAEPDTGWLGDLRDSQPAESDDPRLPALGVADVAALAERMRGAGLPVAVHTSGEPRQVPEDVGLTVYRITQEALTNVLKHAGPASAEVHLRFGSELEVTVTDDGRGASAGLSDSVPGAGRGTMGMRERVSALGGRLTAGPRAGGGFRVHAVIPLEET
jgi:signal transduction histidine kinase